MGRAYTQLQRDAVKALLESGADETSIERDTSVSDRTIRRWKLELEKTGRIGKPPESRTGRHRVLNPEVEQALCEYVATRPDMSVDDMLWWLYETYKIVVGTRTIRRVFERKGEVKGGGKKIGGSGAGVQVGGGQLGGAEGSYESPYAAIVPGQQMPGQMQVDDALARSLNAANGVGMYPNAAPMTMGGDLVGDISDEDEETMQLQLEQIELQKKEVALKLKLRRLQQGKSPHAPGSTRNSSTPSTLYKANANKTASPPPPKRDSRSKKKIEESKKRTAERQDRMLRDLERRSRRREHLTSEWVQSKDIWPLRAQSLLADLMHQYSCYTFTPSQPAAFEAVYSDLYTLVDRNTGDWNPQIHDDLLRERTKRKMAQLRTKMQKTGEIVSRSDGYSGFTKADDYTGEQAGQMLGGPDDIDDSAVHQDVQAGAQQALDQDRHLHYDPVPDTSQGAGLQSAGLQNAGMAASMHPGQPFYPSGPTHFQQGPSPYGLDGGHGHQRHPAMLPYGQVPSQHESMMM
ncbi:hypothetical protein B0A51_18939 [Rachicladosporium sp. CCFEE 5018]|nr:hypothetical protein B0A51_18939 [Rachicladosporium sp. CCFEE 5018]